MEIHLVGAQSTGKTTMAEALSKALNLPLLPEAARIILKEWGTTMAAIRIDPVKANAFQAAIWTKQCELEHTQESFVADRALDHIVYAAQQSDIAPAMFKSTEFRFYVSCLRKRHVFLLRPHRELLEDDGVRLDVSWDSVQRFDGALECLLNVLDIPFVPITDLSMAARIKIVKAVIRKMN